MIDDKSARHAFGVLAFVAALVVIAAVLSPYVSADKEAVANVILGNVLTWPAIALAYYFGSSSGSKAKDGAIARVLDDEA